MSAPKRIRRTPQEARALILDAAEACMAKAGPAGLRLQEVAEVAGVSHPTILHHFESREGLIRAVHLNSLGQLREVLTAAMTGADAAAGRTAGSTASAGPGPRGRRRRWRPPAAPRRRPLSWRR